jgi:signal transduction histidine kinase
VGAAVIAVAAGSELVSFGSDNDVEPAVADGIVGAVLLAAGAIAWHRRPDSRVGFLMGGAGVAWFAGTLWPFAIFWHRGALVHLHLSYPRGRPRWRPAVLTVAGVYAVSAIEPIADNDTLTIAIAGVVAAVAVRTFALASGIARRAGIPALVAALALATALSFGAFNRQYGWQSDRQALWIYDAVIVGAVLILLVDLLRGRWVDAVVTGFVVDLGRRSGTGALRDELARALGDPSLTFGYWSADQERYVDDVGRRVDVDSVPPGHALTPIDDNGSPVAALVHDVAVLDDPALVDSVTAAARLAVANGRLQADTRRRVDELAASRRRLIEAADQQRRRIGQELREQVDDRLDRAQALIAIVASGGADRTNGALDELGKGIEQARVELDELGRGIHPPALTEGGLAAALLPLACRAGIPVALDVSVPRLPPALEVAFYFVCAEALANVAKHAHATTASIHVNAAHGSITAVISDNGRGGANPTLGTGLRGLVDRVEAFGGRLDISNASEIGTRLAATIPTIIA